MCALALAAACSSGVTRSSVPAPEDWTPPTPSLDAAAPNLSADEEGTGAIPPADATSQPSGEGLIAVAGPTGLRLFDPAGRQRAELASERIVIQPTWSRDGRRLVATSINPVAGTAEVVIVDIATGEVTTAAANRPYFFYTWSYDGSRLAALGPGSAAGTTAVNFLDASGEPASRLSLEGQSMYVAWEPGGGRLLLHAGPQLLLLDDPDSLSQRQDLGIVGTAFQAPAWVPGTPDFLYVDTSGSATEDSPAAPDPGPDNAMSPRLMRRSADTGATTDLGPAGSFTLISVHPDGHLAAVSFLSLDSPADAAASLDAELSASDSANQTLDAELSASDSANQTLDAELSASDSANQTLDDSSALAGSVQIVDLATGERRTVLDRPGFWLEWSPDGGHLLIGSTASESGTGAPMAWHTWDGQVAQELAEFTPSQVFAEQYLRFADQYTEMPRLWAPDGTAFAFGALSAGSGVGAVARLDAPQALTSIGGGDVAFWSPADVTLPPAGADGE